jgi:SAM-dependent methyltransferase
MEEARGGLVLEGLERTVVHKRLRAAVGLRWELPRLLNGVAIPAGSRCLEIGTGMGWGTLGLLQHYASIVAVATEYDGSVLPMTRSYIQHAAPGAHVAFCQANAKAFPFPDQTFDIVLALYVLHHVAGYRAAINDIGRVTRPGGRFLFIDVIRATWMPRFPALVPPDGLPSQGELTQMLVDAGFRIERWNGFPIRALVTAWKQ